MGRHAHALFSHSRLSNLGGKYRKNIGNAGQYWPFWGGVHVTASSPKVFKVSIWILQEVFVSSRATILCSYKVWPYAGQSQRDGKVENSLNFKIFCTCIGALYVENGRVKSSISFVRTLHTRTYRPSNWEDMGMHTVATLVCQTWW